MVLQVTARPKSLVSFECFNPYVSALENQLELTEQHLAKINHVPSLYNLSIPTQVGV